MIAALLMFAAAPVVRALMHLLIHNSQYRDLPVFPAVADAIAAGCLVAMVRPRLLRSHAYLRLTRSPWLITLLVPVALATIYSGYTLVDLLCQPLVLACVAVLVEASTRVRANLVGTLLNWRPVAFIGTISYSLYLWQQPFLNPQAHALLNAFPYNVALALVCALVSYYAVELPLTSLRRRWQSRLKQRPPASGMRGRGTLAVHVR
jgi:peptidoglycan/LPS O-acetylase OafA/YrhL